MNEQELIKVKISDLLNFVLVKIEGEITIETIQRLNDEVIHYIIHRKSPQIALNLEKIQSINSEGFKQLIDFQKMIQKKDGLFVLIVSKDQRIKLLSADTFVLWSNFNILLSEDDLFQMQR